MLKHIPPILSPELLKVLAEMGHGDRICLGDGNFPGASIARQSGAILLRADGHGGPQLLEAILHVIPTDSYTDTPVMLMRKMDCDRGLPTPVCDEYRRIVAAHDPRGEAAVGEYERFAFYEQARQCCCILMSGETAVYANCIIQKGVVRQ